LTTTSHPGPLTLIDGQVDEDDVRLAARLVARYSQGRDALEVKVEYTDVIGLTTSFTVQPLKAHEIPEDWHI
jgi:predicted ribosome quality control (RQC) complex YloA/Tae2 family protein